MLPHPVIVNVIMLKNEQNKTFDQKDYTAYTKP